MGNIALIIGLGDCPHYSGVINLLVLIEFMPAGYASGMEMTDHVDVPADCGDQVALHNLHVVNVVQHLETRRVDAPAQFEAPRGFVAHVPGVVDPAVEQFHADSHARILGNLDRLFEDGMAIIHPFGVADSLAVAGHADYVGPLILGRRFDILFEITSDFLIAIQDLPLFIRTHNRNSSICLKWTESFMFSVV